MHRFTLPPRIAAVFFLLAVVSSACALTSNGLDDPTRTPTGGGPALTSTAELLPATAAPTQVVVPPTATTPPPSIAIVGNLTGAPAGSLAALAEQGAQVAAAAHAAQLNTVDLAGADPEATLRQAAQAGNLVVIVVGSDLTAATQAVARDFPNTKFIGVDQAALDSLANYVVIGEPGNRPDEEAFLAGALAGLMTQQHKVGVLTPTAALTGLLYKNGFIHGLRLTCGECALTAFEVEDINSTAKSEKIASDFKSTQVDVVFAAAGPAGDAAVEAAAAQGLWVIGLNQDLSASPEMGPQALGSVLRRPDLVLPDLIGSLLNGQTPASVPFALANGTLTYAPTFGPSVSPAVTQYLANIIPQLTSGFLDTGVDLTTGAEK